MIKNTLSDNKAHRKFLKESFIFQEDEELKQVSKPEVDLTKISDTKQKRFVAFIKLKYSTEYKLYEEILNSIRAVEGITIVTISEPTYSVGEKQQVVEIKVKFQIGASYDITKYLKMLKDRTSKVSGVLSASFKRIIKRKPISS